MKVEPAYAQESQEISPALRVPNAETPAAMDARFDSVDALIDDLEKARQ
jgi:hypothetical protein